MEAASIDFQADGFTLASDSNDAIAIGPGGMTIAVGSGTVTVSAAIVDASGLSSAPGGLTTTGNGTIRLLGDNSFSGGTTLDNGVLIVGGPTALPADGNVTLNNSSVLDLDGISSSSSPLCLATVTVNAGSIVNGAIAASNAFNFGQGLVSADLSGAAGVTVLAGASVILTGVNSYTGRTYVPSGADLYYTQASAIPGTLVGTAVDPQTPLTWSPQDGSTQWSANAANWVYDDGQGNAIQMPWGGSTWAAVFPAGTPAAITVSGTIDVSAIEFDGDGYMISGGNLAVGSNSASATITVPGGDAAEIDSTICGTYGLTDAGGGTLILDGSNNYSGNTTLAGGGAICLNSAAALPQGTSLIVDQGSVVDLGGNTIAGPGLYDVIVNDGYIINGALTASDEFLVTEGAITADLAGSAKFVVDANSSTFNLAGNNTFTGGLLINAGAGLSTNTGKAVPSLSGATIAGSWYMGGDYHVAWYWDGTGGAWQAGTEGHLGSPDGPTFPWCNGDQAFIDGLSNGTITITIPASTNIVADAVTFTGGNYTIAGPGTLSFLSAADAGDFIQVSAGNQTIAVEITGNVTYLQALGTGTLFITNGQNSFSGITEVAGGTLDITGNIGQVYVHSLGTLTGSGSTGNVEVFSRGTLSTGTQTLSTENLQFLSGSYFAAQINSDGTHGQVIVSGTLAINPNARLEVTAASLTDPQAGQSIVLIDNEGNSPVSGNFYGLPEGSPLNLGGVTYFITYHYTTTPGGVGRCRGQPGI